MKLLLHSCCAPCSASIIEWLLANDIRPIIYFFNPNIYPLEEYNIRKAECVRYANALDLELIDGDYDHESWLKETIGLDHEPERGSRCLQCFKMRMLATAKMAHEKKCSHFTTTLASSRWKSLEQISEASQLAASQYQGIDYWEKNWRKGGLSERRKVLLIENDFYNQQYCGCEFSMRRLQKP